MGRGERGKQEIIHHVSAGVYIVHFDYPLPASIHALSSSWLSFLFLFPPEKNTVPKTAWKFVCNYRQRFFGNFWLFGTGFNGILINSDQYYWYIFFTHQTMRYPMKHVQILNIGSTSWMLLLLSCVSGSLPASWSLTLSLAGLGIRVKLTLIRILSHKKNRIQPIAEGYSIWVIRLKLDPGWFLKTGC